MRWTGWKRSSGNQKKVNRLKHSWDAKGRHGNSKSRTLDFNLGNVELMAKASMLEIFQNITPWLATSGIKALGVLITFIILSQMSE
jgi:hypothetical protein